MKRALLGSTGFVGSALLQETLNRGHTATAIVRHPDKLEAGDGLPLRVGHGYKAAALADLVHGDEVMPLR